MGHFKIKVRDPRKYLVVPSSPCTKVFVNTGYVGLKALESGMISSKALESARMAIRKGTKKSGQLVLRANAYLPITKKPSEIRMGKGKGKIKGYVCPVPAGKILFELKNVSLSLAANAMRRGAVKLPIKVKPIVLKDQ